MLDIDLFPKPVLATKEFKVGENTLILSEFTAAFYLDHVLQPDHIEAALNQTEESPEDQRLNNLQGNNKRNLRFCAASVAQSFIGEGATKEQESEVIDKVYQQLKASLTHAKLAEMYLAVLDLANADPKPDGQTENSSTDSAES